jgi:hypothetical protein
MNKTIKERTVMSRTAATKNIKKKAKATDAPKKPKKDKGSKARTALAMNWTATELGPRKRWWWYVGFCAAALWLIIFLFSIKQWTFAACMVAAAAAILVTYIRKPRLLRYSLNDTRITINTASVLFKDYRAFAFSEEASRKTGKTQSDAVLLLPKRRLGLPVEIVLPEDSREADAVLDAIGQILPIDEARSYRARLRFIDRIAQWLRLS